MSVEPVITYPYVAQRQAQVSVRHLCQVLQVAPGAYYAWRHQVPAAGGRAGLFLEPSL